MSENGLTKRSKWLDRIDRGEVESFAEQAFDNMAEQCERAIEAMPDAMTFDEAQTYIEGLSHHAVLHSDGEHMVKYVLGVATLRIKAMADHGTSVTERIADAHDNITLTALRLYVAAARKTHCNAKLFIRWLRTGARPKRQYHLENWLNAKEDPSVYGEELLAKKTASEAERASQSMDKVSDPATRESLSMLMTESAERFRERGIEKLREWDGVPHEEPPEEYFQMVRYMACPCGTTPPEGGFDHFYPLSDPHHVSSGGTGTKGSDWLIMPQCRTCHGKNEDKSPKEFYEETGIDPFVTVIRVLHHFLAGTDVYLPPFR